MNLSREDYFGSRYPTYCKASIFPAKGVDLQNELHPDFDREEVADRLNINKRVPSGK